jgi:hypothetical protein
MLKKLAAICAAASALFVLGAGAAHAAVNDFVGQWTNQDSNTSDVTRVAVTRTGGALRVNVFGSCSPTDCDWGIVNATAFAATAAGNVNNDADVVLATYTQSFARKTVLLRLNGANIAYEVFTEFTDSSGRANYRTSGRLQRVSEGGGRFPGGRIPGVVIPGVVLPGAAISEDCVSFTPGRLRVENVSGRWKITEGSHWVADFGSNRAAADQAHAIILRYGFTSQCFVARPNPPMTYWRRGTNVPNLPTGAGEDCIAVNPANVEARNVNGSWKVVQGNQWMLDFASNRAGAEEAVRIIQHHNLNRQCFVARPNPPMTYWLSAP